MVSKSKTAKTKATKATKSKSTPKKARTSTMTRAATVLHKIDGDPQRMLKLQWSTDHNDFVGTPISMQEATKIALNANAPFCKNTIDDPTHKYYCEFSVEYNQYICTLVDANDPRCRKR
jgi:hypothetical protein